MTDTTIATVTPLRLPKDPTGPLRSRRARQKRKATPKPAKAEIRALKNRQ
jgi:hypothetical protein